ncbi:DUF4349 domain-containing protein [Streptomyces roseicoloratus]|uniref:DUF4349 domain-containing protein n=1 Tax=Streptomyces roseicoloratus TaxID=2508722 RepID=UPI001009A089|nr:DUF4349 domain-containing protein [Streptomyces roseicoloratus]
MRRGRTAAATALLTVSLVLTGCGANDIGAGAKADGKGGVSAEKPAYAGPESAADGAAGTGSGAADTASPASTTPPGGSARAAARQHVIRTAELDVEVGDATKGAAAARRVVAGAGGHVENETTERVDDTHVTSRLVLRVPQERYDSVLAELAGAGRLLARRADAKDVTEQVVDVESRVATQRASVARVRALMDRATRLSDVVTLEGELSRRQAELESLLAQQASLKDRTTLATITLRLSEPEGPHAAEEDRRPGLGDALRGGWDALVAAVAWILVVLAALAPWLAVGAVLYAVWRRALRPRLRRRARDRADARGARPWPAPDAAGAANAAGVPAARAEDPEDRADA